MNPIVIPELLLKYVDGKCSAKEVDAIYRWYDTIGDTSDPFVGMSEEEEAALMAVMFDRFKNSLEEQHKHGKKAYFNFLNQTAYRFTGIAAILVLLILGVFYLTSNPPADDVSVMENRGTLIINNQTGRFYKKVLVDGTIVWLDPNSRLEYPEKFNGKYRKVQMWGGAFFEVSKDINHPFIIYSGGLVTKVWGTSFRINSFDGNPTEVSVVTGKVSVGIPKIEGSEVMLLPLQKVVHIPKHSTLTLGDNLREKKMLMWRKSAMVFQETALNVILTQLSQHFEVQIYTKDKALSSNILRADFSGLNLPEILELLQSSVNAGYTINGDQIELYHVK